MLGITVRPCGRRKFSSSGSKVAGTVIDTDFQIIYGNSNIRGASFPESQALLNIIPYRRKSLSEESEGYKYLEIDIQCTRNRTRSAER